jgi:hypothetical protein
MLPTNGVGLIQIDVILLTGVKPLVLRRSA